MKIKEAFKKLKEEREFHFCNTLAPQKKLQMLGVSFDLQSSDISKVWGLLVQLDYDHATSEYSASGSLKYLFDKTKFTKYVRFKSANLEDLLIEINTEFKDLNYALYDLEQDITSSNPKKYIPILIPSLAHLQSNIKKSSGQIFEIRKAIFELNTGFEINRVYIDLSIKTIAKKITENYRTKPLFSIDDLNEINKVHSDLIMPVIKKITNEFGVSTKIIANEVILGSAEIQELFWNLAVSDPNNKELNLGLRYTKLKYAHFINRFYFV